MRRGDTIMSNTNLTKGTTLRSQTVLDRVRRLMQQEPIYLDTETTGLGEHDEIVEIAILNHDGTVLLSTLVKPTIPIPPDAMRLHGITEAMVANARDFVQVWPEAAAIIANRPLVIYNAQYDLRMLRQSARAHRLPIDLPSNTFCAMELYAAFYGEWDDYRRSYRWHKLGNAAKQCGIQLPKNLHRATADAEITRQIMLFMAGVAATTS